MLKIATFLFEEPGIYVVSIVAACLIAIDIYVQGRPREV